MTKQLHVSRSPRDVQFLSGGIHIKGFSLILVFPNCIVTFRCRSEQGWGERRGNQSKRARVLTVHMLPKEMPASWPSDLPGSPRKRGKRLSFLISCHLPTFHKTCISSPDPPKKETPRITKQRAARGSSFTQKLVNETVAVYSRYFLKQLPAASTNQRWGSCQPGSRLWIQEQQFSNNTRRPTQPKPRGLHF